MRNILLFAWQGGAVRWCITRSGQRATGRSEELGYVRGLAPAAAGVRGMRTIWGGRGRKGASGPSLNPRGGGAGRAPLTEFEPPAVVIPLAEN